MAICKKDHRHWEMFEELPKVQGGFARHKCAGCAYELGYNAGLKGREIMGFNIEAIPDSQAGTVRHRSPHAAYAKGYYDGVCDSAKK